MDLLLTILGILLFLAVVLVGGIVYLIGQVVVLGVAVEVGSRAARAVRSRLQRSSGAHGHPRPAALEVTHSTAPASRGDEPTPVE